MGLNRIAGLSTQAIDRVICARKHKQFTSVQDLAQRAQLERSDLNALAAAGALKSLAGHRYQAVWETSGVLHMPRVLANATVSETPIRLKAPSAAEDLIADYASLGLTLGRHPLAMLGETLKSLRIQSSAVLKNYPHGRLARAAGLVTHRQRPSTAKGTLFISLEDEAGIINVVVWPDVLKRFYKPVLYAQLMVVYGVWQRDRTIDASSPGQVCNLLAQRVEDRTDLLHHLLGDLETSSRDFH